jgi:hypothetical protein
MPYTEAQRKNWSAYAAKTSMRDAAIKFGVSATAIRAAMKANGVKPRRPGAPRSYTPAQIGRAFALVLSKKSSAEIEAETGIPGKYARELVRKMGGAKA